jgi:hypothetical protein
MNDPGIAACLVESRLRFFFYEKKTSIGIS